MAGIFTIHSSTGWCIQHMKRLIFIRLLSFCGITYLLGMFLVPLMDIDATQYASISREMMESGNYLQLYDLGRDYLDKPPMLFWLSSASMQVFGVHDWAYRLPSFLFSLLAIYSTYRLALLFYKKDVALLAALVLASCQAMDGQRIDKILVNISDEIKEDMEE